MFVRFCCILVSLLCFCMNSYAVPFGDGIQTYHKNLHFSEEHKQKLADDINRYRNADNLWDALRNGFSLHHYENHPAVQEKIEWYMRNQDFLLRSASRAAPYLFYIYQQVNKRHLPVELVLLPIVESGYNPYSLSNMGAAGIWQLMPGTASGYGVKRTGWYDGRRDVIASTNAALTYLAYLQSFFEGNWLYAIAAYNTGEGNVLSALKKNIRAGENTDFWSLPLAQETRSYVPSILALAVILSHPERYPIYLPPVRNAPYLAQVDVGRPIDLKHAASLAGLAHQKLMQLNSAYSQHRSSNQGPYKILLPIENVAQFSENLSTMSDAPHTIRWRHYSVKSGDTLASIANKFDVSVSDLRKLNRLTSTTISKGINLLIPGDDNLAAHDESAEEPTQASETRHHFAKRRDSQEKSSIASIRVAENDDTASTANLVSAGRDYRMQPGDTIYMVRDNDSISSIAKRFQVSTSQIHAANPNKNGKITKGTQLIIPTHAKLTHVQIARLQSTRAQLTRAQLTRAKKTQQRNDGLKNTKIMPTERTYVVKRGDTIDKIAKKLHTSAASIRVANAKQSNTVRAGERLIIPHHA